MELEYVLILALFGIAMILLIAVGSDMVFIYYEHVSLPVSLPIP
jgi:hypothetical protein